MSPPDFSSAAVRTAGLQLQALLDDSEVVPDPRVLDELNPQPLPPGPPPEELPGGPAL